MLRPTSRIFPRSERGQVLPLFALMIMLLIGFMAMSIDVGRYVWARTSMQAGVDAAALAAAQSMPDQVAATNKANEYWLDNSGFIQSNGYNVGFAVTYPVGNKAISIHGEADVSTWFAKFFGVDHWHVSADGDAASQVLDIAVVLDISGSMCNHPALPSFPSVETGSALMSPGRATPTGGFSFPVLADGDLATAGVQGIPASTAASIVIQLNDVRIFTSAVAANNNTNFGTQWNSTTPYWQRVPSSVRAGMILIANSNNNGYELFQITAVNVALNQLTVTRARTNNKLGVATVQAPHAVGAEIWANRYDGPNGTYCQATSKFNPTSSTNGPTHPFDDAVDNAKYFITLFNSNYDKIGFADFSTTGSIVSNLSSNFASLNSSLDGILYPGGSTNIAHGIGRGRAILDGAGKRANAVRVLVVLTDGIPNKYCTNGYDAASCTTGSTSDPTSCPYASNASISAAISQAGVAKAEKITVYTIGLGSGVLDCILVDVATAGGGTYYKAPTPADLDAAFQSIAEQTHIALIK